MLSIKKSLSFSLPKLHSSKPMQLSAVTVDDAELSRSLDSDPDEHDNNWELNERPDENELEAFWNTVEADVKKDPSWFAFDND